MDLSFLRYCYHKDIGSEGSMKLLIFMNLKDLAVENVNNILVSSQYRRLKIYYIFSIEHFFFINRKILTLYILSPDGEKKMSRG